MTFEIETRLKGKKDQYYILRIMEHLSYFTKVKAIHTSKDINYLRRLIRERYSK